MFKQQLDNHAARCGSGIERPPVWKGLAKHIPLNRGQIGLDEIAGPAAGKPAPPAQGFGPDMIAGKRQAAGCSGFLQVAPAPYAIRTPVAALAAGHHAPPSDLGGARAASI